MSQIINPEKYLIEALNYFKNGKGLRLFNVGNILKNSSIQPCLVFCFVLFHYAMLALVILLVYQFVYFIKTSDIILILESSFYVELWFVFIKKSCIQKLYELNVQVILVYCLFRKLDLSFCICFFI